MAENTTGLRRRAVAGTPGHAPAPGSSPKAPIAEALGEPAVTLTKLQAAAPVPARTPLLRRAVPLPAVMLALVLALGVGMGLGTVGALKVLCTWDYPRLDAQMQKLMKVLGLRVNIEVLDTDEDDVEVVSCTPDQPLVERRDGVLDPAVFAQVQECLTDHPKITKNHLNPNGFNGTRGFVINFSGDGVDTFREETKFNCGDFNPLLPFFDAARHPETNGFVMNVLVCDKPTDINVLSVGEHVDDTLAHNKVWRMKSTGYELSVVFNTSSI
jgi:hypothetical protein